MLYNSVVDCIGHTPIVTLQNLFPHPMPLVMAKLEFLNPGGSVKDRVARFIISRGLQTGVINQDTHLLESSSGNLGIALAMVARLHKLAFTCVVDPKIAHSNLKLLHLFGAQVEMVSERDDQGSYLKTRIKRVHELLERIPRSYWINQYANDLNWQTHFMETGEEILEALETQIDCLVVAVSTTGTMLGLARRLRQAYPHLRVIAVDAVGSVIFGGTPGIREIPGIGASRVPELLRCDEVNDVIFISDREAVQGCRELAQQEGIFAGGSSGFVIAALKKLLPTLPSETRILTILPDRGERYLDSVYNEEWVARLPV
jgi:cysteine synthase A